MAESVLDTLEESIDVFDQLSLTNRIAVRLGRHIQGIYGPKEYTTEDELLQDFPISNKKFTFDNWHTLHDELLATAWSKKEVPNALYSYIVRCIGIFEQASYVVYPTKERSDTDRDTGEILKYLAYGCGYLYAFHPSEGRHRLLHVLNDLGLISDSAAARQSATDEEIKFIQDNHNDLALLYQLIDSMNALGHIIQGVLFEVGADKSLFQLQEECGVILCEDLYAWRLGNLTSTTTKFARQMIGGQDRSHITDYKPEDEKPEDAKEKARRRQATLPENLTALCHRLKPDYIKQKDKETWAFRGDAALYAYMCYRIAERCEFKTIPWQSFKQFILVGSDSNYLKQRASRMKKDKQYPKGYTVINDAIDAIFK